MTLFDRDELPAPKRTVKESILLLLSATLGITVTPFLLVRLRDEQWAVAILDCTLVCVMLIMFVYVYSSRRTKVPGIVMTAMFVGGALLTTRLLGPGQIYWLYPALAAAFFMIGTRPAALVSLLSIGTALYLLWGEQPMQDTATVMLTLVTTTLFAYSFALSMRRQQRKLRHMANVDPLTGAGNRRAQTEKLDTVNAIFRRSDSPSSILILDVDFFKKINDSYGHVTGDQILVEVADLLRSHTRATESLYRYGGEEFVVIAEQTGLDAAIRLAEKIRELAAQNTFSASIKLTVSIGVAELHRGEGRQGWLGRADAALFEAKRRGRNQVVVAPPPKQDLSRVQVLAAIPEAH